MPKKRAPIQFAKPFNPIHPSLASSSNEPKSRIVPHSLHSPPSSSGNSVNDQIQRLRLSQTLAASVKTPRAPINTQPMPSSSLVSAAAASNPGPGPDPHPAGRRRRGISRRPAGPPPPKSWLKNRPHVSAYLQRIHGPDTRQPVRLPCKCLDMLPGLYIPNEQSLMSQALKGLARNWAWHLEWDQYRLTTLPTRYKEALLYYIIQYSPKGICRDGLEILFLDQTVQGDDNDSEDLIRLDFATAIGRSLSLKDVEDFLSKAPSRATDGESSGQTETVPETWDAPSASPLSYISVSHFPSLTHLSLSHPINASWKALLSLVSHLATLTHLSLAFWPPPTLHANPQKHTDLPIGYGYYNPTLFFTYADTHWIEAAAILRHLSKKTYCLKWLDLTGCFEWIWALRCEGGADWSGAWRKLETIKSGQGWFPDCLKDETFNLRQDHNDGFRPVIRQSVNDLEFDLEHQQNHNSKKALANWLQNEKHIASLEKIVNEQKSRVVQRNADRLAGKGPSVDELVFRRGEFESWWEDAQAPQLKGAESDHDCGGNRVVFERGWEGWWIEDSIAAIDKLS